MNTPDKIARKRQQLIERTAAALSVSETEAERLFSIERKSSFRINTNKVEDELSLLAELSHLGWHGVQSKIYELGYTISDGRSSVVDSPAAQNGQIFIQNQASLLPVLALDPKPGEKILDMCAAPGGKSAHIAELTDGQAELWVNDNSRNRLFKLRSNFERLGVRYDKLTMYGIDRLPHVMSIESFDKVLLDAPCSGEGLIDINRAKDFEYWSLAQIKRLQQLQKKGVSAAWRLLKPGGTLVYSTCTIAPEENEAVINYLLTRNDDAELEPINYLPTSRVPALSQWGNKDFTTDLSDCVRLAPSEYFEAFFVAKITKKNVF